LSLDGWDGSDSNSSWPELVDAVSAVVARGGAELAGAKPPAGERAGSAGPTTRRSIPNGAASFAPVATPLSADAEEHSAPAQARRLAMIASIGLSVLMAGGLATGLLTLGGRNSPPKSGSAAPIVRPSATVTMANTAPTSGVAPVPEAFSEVTPATPVQRSSGKAERAGSGADPLAAPSDADVAASLDAATNAALAGASSSILGAAPDGGPVAASGVVPAAVPIEAPADRPPRKGSSEEQPTSDDAPLAHSTNTP
jgi:hypothetical protein